MNFSAYSIKNPLIAILIFTLMTVGGILGFRAMKIQQFPDIDVPAVIVTVSYTGASPAQLETDVAKKIENQITGIEGVKHIRSTLQTGVVTIHTEFTLEKDLSEAVNDVRSALDEIASDLPAAAEEPVITKVSTAGFPVVSYSVASDNMSEAELSWFVDDTLNKRLANINGVGTLSRVGGIERQIIITPDVNKLNGWQLPITNLSQQISASQKDSSGGEAKVGGGVQTIRVLGSAKSVRELASLEMVTPAGGVALGQLADIKDAHADPKSRAILDGQTVVALSITRSRGASEVQMVEDVDQELAKLAQEMPHIKIQKIYDNAEPVAEDYHASMKMLIEGCILAVVVVFLFLRDWRATLVAAAALPLSIIPTFLMMWIFGFSLNIISLLALSLVIGVLVDDAIVEVENIMRHLHMGKTPYEAAMEAADEIGLAVVATTFTLIAVFLPTAFMSGVVGQFFSQFGWTAAISVFISLLVARLVTPMMAAYILKPKRHKEETSGAMTKRYLSVVRWTLNHRAITLVATIVLFIGSLSIAKMLPGSFLPPDDSNQTQVTLELTPDATLDDTTRISQMTAQAVSQVDGVSSVFISAGSENTATLNILLNPRSERLSKTDIENAIAEAVKDVPSARFVVGLSATGDSGYGFSLMSDNPELLNQTVNETIKQIQSLPMVLSVTSNRPLAKPELSAIPNTVMMADKGVTTSDLADTLRVATMGDYEQALSKLNLDTRQIPVVVRLSDESRADMNVLSSLYVPSSTSEAGAVKLSEVATLRHAMGEAEIRRLDRMRSIKITVQSEEELGEVINTVKNLPILQNLPEGVNAIDEGQADSMAELFTGFAIAMSVGIFCIFGVLVLLFHKVLQPFTILMALPLSIGGAFIGLVVTGASLSISSLIGFIMLMGIATKNSILLVDYAIIAEKAGLQRLDAILDACKKRARPIIMTTIAMGAGMLPLVFGWGGADATFRRPMAVAVLGGLITSTFLSLVVIPVVYTLMDDLGRFFKRKRSAQSAS
ncbi:ACR/RND family transmembrane transporter [Moraxella ovis]|uniref:ACR/RND family transmembrane transporter n=1 Tax=Moraxella ovis TaxID=29433 RepID=A0A378PMV6_9GAMM|nr:efflux RND transporter permease subunit [Moraxella ovis]ANB92194.1 ACR/RND family transmembrane transporter [Moraxella ovis]STY87991.1 Multidrug transporter MdtC [Moraxella ovis]